MTNLTVCLFIVCFCLSFFSSLFLSLSLSQSFVSQFSFPFKMKLKKRDRSPTHVGLAKCADECGVVPLGVPVLMDAITRSRFLSHPLRLPYPFLSSDKQSFRRVQIKVIVLLSRSHLCACLCVEALLRPAPGRNRMTNQLERNHCLLRWDFTFFICSFKLNSSKNEMNI